MIKEKDTLEILKNGFKATKSYQDSEPLLSIEHPVYINGIEVKGTWLRIHHWICTFHEPVYDEDGFYIDWEDTATSKVLMTVFEKIFISAHKKDKQL